MKFSEAMEKLKSGSKVTRKPWSEGVYFKLIDGLVKSFQPKLSPYIYNEDIMISEGWSVEGIEGELSFYEIIPHLRNGLNARLKDWDQSYIYFDRQDGDIIHHSMYMFPFMPDFNSFNAEDWIELE